MTVMGENVMKRTASPKWNFVSGLAGALLCVTAFAVTPASAAEEGLMMKHQEIGRASCRERV